MRHDTILHAVPQTATLHPRRTLELEVWCRYIDLCLSAKTEAMPFGLARNLLRRLEAADVAQVRHGSTESTIQMHGVSARSNGGEYALLQNWKSAAWAKIEEAQE